MAELLGSYRRLGGDAHAAQAASTQLGSECDRLRQYAHSLERVRPMPRLTLATLRLRR
jgi:hypothetical protein